MEITLKSPVDVYIDIRSLGIADSSKITYCSASFVKNEFSYCKNKCFGKCVSENSYLEQSSLSSPICKCCSTDTVCQHRNCLETDLYNIVYKEGVHYLTFDIPSNNALVGSYNLILNVTLTNPPTNICKTYEGILTFISGSASDSKVTIKIKSKYGDDFSVIYSKQVYDADLDQYQNIINQEYSKQINNLLLDLLDSLEKINNVCNNINTVNDNLTSLLLNVDLMDVNVSLISKNQQLCISDIATLVDDYNKVISKFPIQTSDISQNTITYDKLSSDVRKKIEDAYNSGGNSGDTGSTDLTKHILLSYAEYTKIRYPDPDTVYFIYDDSEPVDPEPTTNTSIKDKTIFECGTIEDNRIITQAKIENYILTWQQ